MKRIGSKSPILLEERRKARAIPDREYYCFVHHEDRHFTIVEEGSNLNETTITMTQCTVRLQRWIFSSVMVWVGFCIHGSRIMFIHPDRYRRENYENF